MECLISDDRQKVYRQRRNRLLHFVFATTTKQIIQLLLSWFHFAQMLSEIRFIFNLLVHMVHISFMYSSHPIRPSAQVLKIRAFVVLIHECTHPSISRFPDVSHFFNFFALFSSFILNQSIYRKAALLGTVKNLHLMLQTGI